MSEPSSLSQIRDAMTFATLIGVELLDARPELVRAAKTKTTMNRDGKEWAAGSNAANAGSGDSWRRMGANHHKTARM